MTKTAHKPLSIYVHVPFCEKKCPYCDFHSREISTTLDGEGEILTYVENLCKEINASQKKCHEYSVQTIYFGGGTPSVIDGRHIEKILNTIRENFAVADGAEISIECNPNSVTREKLEIYRGCGINRVSIGVQSFSNRALKILGRLHNVKQAKSAIKISCEYFENVGIDLMHSIPGARFKFSRANRQILKKVRHISAYCLTSARFKAVNDRISIREQSRIERILAKNSLAKYEVSNFARPGWECAHNLVYWTCGEWLGFGAGAKSHFDEPWTKSDRIMLGLRLVWGIPQNLFEGKEAVVDGLVAGGFLCKVGENIACTPRGFLILNQILCRLVD